MHLSRRGFLGGAGAVAFSRAEDMSWVAARGNAVCSRETAGAGNPIVIGKGLCDPQVRVYDGRVYLYATHDASPDNRFYRMRDWWIWTTDDLLTWSEAGVLRPEDTYWKRPSEECWATDAIRRNGRYYFYFSRGPEEIGVVTSENPIGPWKDPLGKPLIAAGSTPTSARDPGILQEADGTSYIVFGCWDYFIVRLNDDMISLAEPPRRIELDQKSGPYGAGKLDDKPFLHVREGLYYLSWGCYYATSWNIYGPYQYRGSILEPGRTAPEFRRNLTLDRHGSFFELHRQWYFICNDQDWPGASEHFRNSVISYVLYRDNGEIETIDLNQLGVGQYCATEGAIDAAKYFSCEEGQIRQSADGGFEVQGLRNGSTLAYPHVRRVPRRARIWFEYASAHPGGFTVEIRRGSAFGSLMGSCQVASQIPKTEGWQEYKTTSCVLDNEAGDLSLCLLFRGGEGELLRLRRFRFIA